MPVPKDQYAEFAQMWVDNVPSKTIAARFSISQSHVSRVRINLGLEKRRIFAHGASAYSTGKCRCDICTAANTKRQRLANQLRYADRPKDPLDPRHGTPSFYSNHGCRCTACRSAWAVFCKKMYAGRKARGLLNSFLSESATALPVA